MVSLHVAMAWATPVAVPPDDVAPRWEQALSLVGLHVDTPGPSGPAVWIEPGDPRWTLRVRDQQGVVRSIDVDPPRDQRAREEVAFLASSLLQPVVEVPLAPPPRTPERPARRSVVEPAAEPAADPGEPAAEPWVLRAPTLWVPEARVPWVPAGQTWQLPDRPPRWWVAAGLGAVGRRQVRAAPWLEVQGGGHVRPWLVWSAGLQGGLPAGLEPVEEGRTVQMLRGWSTLLSSWRGWGGGAGVGLSWRQFAEPAAPVVRAWIPDVHLATQRGLLVGTAMLRVRVEVAYDLVPIDLVVGDEAPRRLAPWSIGAGVTVGTRASGGGEDRVRR